MNAGEVRELARIAQESDVFLMEAMWMKFNPLFVRLQELLDAGAIGHVRSLRASFGAPFPEDGSSRWQPGGSALLDQGIYPVTLSHMLFGKPDSISAAGLVREDGVDLRNNFTLNHDAGAFTQGAASMLEFLDMSATIAGTRGWITIGSGFWYASQLTVHGYNLEGETVEPVKVDREGYGYTPMLRAVTDAIRRGAREHPSHTLQTTADIFDTLDAIRSSLSSTRPTTPAAPMHSSSTDERND
ncbi:Gfo/Idh/MocA family protein [Microbacterium sp. 2MCAF23]|uniref:Gfo/Idh/MocA family protein n=1 Tax=Microbacterium sp. 2MCAF23 TaxID=3232985 RepID=UPI003F9788E2